MGKMLPFNWTKVELKRTVKEALKAPEAAFNWTKVELKQYFWKFLRKYVPLLIELR